MDIGWVAQIDGDGHSDIFNLRKAAALLFPKGGPIRPAHCRELNKHPRHIWILKFIAPRLDHQREGKFILIDSRSIVRIGLALIPKHASD